MHCCYFYKLYKAGQKHDTWIEGGKYSRFLANFVYVSTNVFFHSCILFSKIPAEAGFDVINVGVLMTHTWSRKQKVSDTILFPLHPTSFRSWQRLFSRSVAVHFFSHTSSKLKVVDDPRYSAYALLGM